MDLELHKPFHQLVNNGIDIDGGNSVITAGLFYPVQVGTIFHVLRPPEKPHSPADLVENPVLEGQLEKPVNNSDHFLLILRQFAVNGFNQVVSGEP